MHYSSIIFTSLVNKIKYPLLNIFFLILSASLDSTAYVQSPSSKNEGDQIQSNKMGNSELSEDEIMEKTLAIWKEKNPSHEIIDSVLNPLSGKLLQSVRIFERSKRGKDCKEIIRDLEFKKLDEKISLTGMDFVMGQNCCKGSPCTRRSPSGWFMELIRREADKSILDLYSPNYGFTVKYRNKLGRKIKKSNLLDSDSHFQANFSLHKDFFDCPKEFDSKGLAVCNKSAGGEGYTFTWKKDWSGVYLIGFETIYEE